MKLPLGPGLGFPLGQWELHCPRKSLLGTCGTGQWRLSGLPAQAARMAQMLHGGGRRALIHSPGCSSAWRGIKGVSPGVHKAAYTCIRPPTLGHDLTSLRCRGGQHASGSQLVNPLLAIGLSSQQWNAKSL